MIVDDASSRHLRPALPNNVGGVAVRVVRSTFRLGVGAARNLAAKEARGTNLLITDAHVSLSDEWDCEVEQRLVPGRILAVTICEAGSGWKGYGCSLVVPHMGTRWNAGPVEPGSPVQIASSAGTVIERSLFHAIGGYDEGMLIYGGFEPEFSVRAWRWGAEIVAAPSIEVTHRFKPSNERAEFCSASRTYIEHNCMRFGVGHLPDAMILEMVRLHALEFPNQVRDALRLLESRGAWQRRLELSGLRYDFAWFARRFELVDQAGDRIAAADA